MSNCDTVRELLMDVARGVPSDSSLRMHLENCPDCRRRLANERMLSAGLAAMAACDVPPASVQAAVLTEFRRLTLNLRPAPVGQTIVFRGLPAAQQPHRRQLVKWFAMAAAAVILPAVFLATKHHPRKIVATVVQAPVHARTAPVPIAPAATAKDPTPVKRHRAAKVQPLPAVEVPPAVETPEVATDFFAIPYSEPLRPEERVDVFRMQMPRANMAVFGLPVAGGRLDSRVTADVLIGEDGVMRAIRFIR